MKKRNIQKVIVKNWTTLYGAFLTGDINFYEFQVSESTLSEISQDLLNISNLAWLSLNYVHYRQGKVEDWDIIYPNMDKETIFNMVKNEFGYEVN